MQLSLKATLALAERIATASDHCYTNWDLCRIPGHWCRQRPLSIVIRMRQSLRQPNLPASFAWTQVLQGEKLSGIYAIELMKLTDKVHNTHNSGNFSNLRTKSMESFFIPVSNFAVLHFRIQTDFSSLELIQLRLLWWIIRWRIWLLSLSYQTSVSKPFSGN